MLHMCFKLKNVYKIYMHIYFWWQRLTFSQQVDYDFRTNVIRPTVPENDNLV